MSVGRLRIFLGTAAFCALLAPALAQWTSDKPPVLRPQDYPPQATEDPPDPNHQAKAPERAEPESVGPQNARRPVSDVSDLPPIGAEPPTSAGRSHRAPVEVDALGTPEGPPVGLLDAKGGFGEHIWSGSERGKVETLLAQSPLVSADPVLRDLNRRLVLSKAPSPPGQAKRAFITVRIERLLDAGLIQEAGGLAAQAALANDDDFARVQASAILYANRAQDACGAATQKRNSAGEVFWLQLRAYCAAVAGDSATTSLTRDVLTAQGHNDAAFDSLLDSVLNKRPVPPGAIAQPNAVHVFLLQQNGLPIPLAVARKMGTPANVLVLRDSRNAPRARFEAAERVVQTGAASAMELRLIADAQELPLNRLANAAADAPGLPYFMGQVVLRRAASVAPRPDEKLRLMTVALSLGQKAGMLPLTAAFQGDVLASLKPTPGSASRRIAQALVLAKRYEAAAKWSAGDAVLPAVIAIASQDGARLAAVQNDLAAFAEPSASPDPDHRYKALVLGLAQALSLSDTAAAAPTSPPSEGKRPSAEDMRGLQEAAARPERRGEALLRLTGLVNSIGLRAMAPDVTITFVRMLIAMDEGKAARGLAIEAMAQYEPSP